MVISFFALIYIEAVWYNFGIMTVTIPTKLTSGKELVIIPSEEYEALVELKRIYEFQPSSAQKKVLSRARSNRKAGKVLTLGQFKRSLGLTD